MICATCGKPLEWIQLSVLRLRHVRTKTMWCYDMGPERASMPVIVEDFDPTDAMRDASHDAYDATCATRDT